MAFRVNLYSTVACAAMAAAPTLGRAAVVNQWVQFAPNKTVLLRAIESNPANGCPAALVDGAAVTLTPRGNVTTPSQAPQTYFPVLMCESAPIPAFGHTSASIGTVSLKMPVTNPRTILFIGDTGCRVTASVASTQNCNDPTQFPLQFIANYAATFKPDLIVHVGDYFYREQPCPTGFTGCAGNPVFDNWDSWNADWFTPAANLIAAAPLALSRGNHESCNRGAHGWYELLDAYPYDNNAFNCTGPYTPMVGAPGKVGPLTPYDFEPPYTVNAGQVTLLMFDSSDSNTTAPDTATVATTGQTLPQAYTSYLNGILPSLVSSNVFYVTHKSSYDIRPALINGNLGGGDATQQSVFNGITPGGVPSQIKLLVSGHDHQFEVVDFASSNYAPQLTTGNSGTLLDNQTGTQPQAFTPDTTPTDAGKAYALPGISSTATTTIQANADQSVYGFTVLTAATGGYVANVYNTASAKLARCVLTLNPRSMLCVQ